MVTGLGRHKKTLYGVAALLPHLNKIWIHIPYFVTIFFFLKCYNLLSFEWKIKKGPCDMLIIEPDTLCI